jgi:DNA-directed RNA polymerase II subunit RPB2
METGTVNLYNPALKTTNYGDLLQKIVRKDGFATNIIENYNNEIDKLKEVISSMNIETREAIVSFSNVQFRQPVIEVGGTKVPMTPMMSREKINPYCSEIVCDITYTMKPIAEDIYGNPIANSNYKEPETHYNISIGYIPVMLGSKLCLLSGKTPEERMEMGECFNDFFGYFIISSERIIINQEKLRFSTFLIWEQDGQVVGNVTCPTIQGTTLTKIMITKNRSLIVYLSHLSKKRTGIPPFPPIFAIYKLFGKEMDEAISDIMSFIDEEHHNAVRFQLEPSIADYYALMDGFDEKEYLIEKLLATRKSMESRVTIDRIVPDIERDLFPHIPEVKDKLEHLTIYAAKMLEYMIGIRKLDDRDSYANKKIETAGTKITQLFKAVWYENIQTISEKVKDAKSLREIENNFSAGTIKDNMTGAFGPNAWGTKKMRKKENITESLKRDTPVAIFAQIQKINVSASRRSTTPKLRMPHGSGLGYIDPFDTPEGEGTGLVRNFSCTCYISLEKDSGAMIDFCKNDKRIKKYVYNQRYLGTVPLMVNGVIKFWCIPDESTRVLKKFKNENLYYKDACVFYNKRDKCVEFSCDGGRPVRPLLVVNDNGELAIDTKKMWDADIDDLVRSQCIEYVDAREQEWTYLAESVDYVRQRKAWMDELETSKDEYVIKELKAKLSETIPYQYCEIDPASMFSISGDLVPQANRQAGPRTAYQIGMFKQALSQYHSNEHLRFDASYKMLHYPKKALFQTDMQDTAGLNLMPNGLTTHVAIMAHPDNPEDCIVVKEEAIKYANIFDMAKKLTVVSKIATNAANFNEKIKMPVINVGEKQGKYHAINEDGIPRLDAFIRPGDCILGKVREYTKSTLLVQANAPVNISEFASVGDEGYIDRVLITKNVTTSEQIVKIKIRQTRKYQAGDKMAMRYSQKGTVARLIPARELPMVASGPLKGMVPDLIVNPHSQPSRMTINNIIEILVSKAAAITGEFVNATTYRAFAEEMEKAQQVLEDFGLDRSGKEEFVHPNGVKMAVKCFFGPVHYQALRHHVVDKIQMRARKGVKPSTRQPIQGRSNEGGLKVGEMERDALISHGASALLRERLCDVSDAYNLPVCKCGVIAITNYEQNIYKCTACGPNAKIGVIRIPYVVKLLMHFLNGAGIHMKFNVSEVVTDGGRPEEKFLM